MNICSPAHSLSNTSCNNTKRQQINGNHIGSSTAICSLSSLASQYIQLHQEADSHHHPSPMHWHCYCYVGSPLPPPLLLITGTCTTLAVSPAKGMKCLSVGMEGIPCCSWSWPASSATGWDLTRLSCMAAALVLCCKKSDNQGKGTCGYCPDLV